MLISCRMGSVLYRIAELQNLHLYIHVLKNVAFLVLCLTYKHLQHQKLLVLYIVPVMSSIYNEGLFSLPTSILDDTRIKMLSIQYWTILELKVYLYKCKHVSLQNQVSTSILIMNNKNLASLPRTGLRAGL